MFQRVSEPCGIMDVSEENAIQSESNHVRTVVRDHVLRFPDMPRKSVTAILSSELFSVRAAPESDDLGDGPCHYATLIIRQRLLVLVAIFLDDLGDLCG